MKNLTIRLLLMAVRLGLCCTVTMWIALQWWYFSQNVHPFGHTVGLGADARGWEMKYSPKMLFGWSFRAGPTEEVGTVFRDLDDAKYGIHFVRRRAIYTLVAKHWFEVATMAALYFVLTLIRRRSAPSP